MKDEIRLYKKRFYSAFTVDADLASRVKLANPAEWIGVDVASRILCAERDDAEFRLRQYVLGTKPEVLERTYPSTWWDAVKDRFFPRWLRRWFPVSYESFRWERCGLYPEIPIPGGLDSYTCAPFLEESISGYTDRG